MKIFTHLSKAPFAQHSVLPESVFGYWLPEKYQESDIGLLKVRFKIHKKQVWVAGKEQAKDMQCLPLRLC